MSPTQHRPDLIRVRRSRTGWDLTLYRLIGGLEWKRKVGPNDFLTLMEAGKVLQVHRVTLYDWISAGVIRAYPSKYGLRIRWRDLRKFGRDQGLLP